MPRYLTQEWLDAAEHAIAADASLARAGADVTLVVQQVVTGGPDGDVRFHIDVDRGTVHVRNGEASSPTVTFIQTWATATAVARGELSAQGAFMSGRIQIRGELPTLVAHGPVFAGVDDALAALRADTQY